MSILAERVGRIMDAYVVEDQTGFIKNRFMKDIRKLIKILDKARYDNISTVPVFLNVEKVFDRLKWPYLKKVVAIWVWPMFPEMD